jgi:NADH:ubiquinone oxidoreductase subunit 2 (subunit N)
MMAALGVGAYTAAVFHLFTHAFFKALLFLGSGAVIHAVHSNNMSEMGGLRRRLPITFWTFLIGSLALSGVPPLAGFWSKDELLVVAEHEGHPVLFVVLPLCVRFFGSPGEPRAKASGKTVVGFAAFLTVLTAIEVALIPDLGLGTTFWIVAILIPSLEFLGFLSRRESRALAESEPS